MLEPKLHERLRARATGFDRPLIAEPHGNCSIACVRPLPHALEVWHHWRDRKNWDRCEVPWEAILEDRVRYSINAHYCVERRVGFCPLSACLHADVPEGHELLHGIREDELLFVVTTSDQGYKDGELLMPFNTVQVFLLEDAGPGTG